MPVGVSPLARVARIVWARQRPPKWWAYTLRFDLPRGYILHEAGRWKRGRGGGGRTMYGPEIYLKKCGRQGRTDWRLEEESVRSGTRPRSQRGTGSHSTVLSEAFKNKIQWSRDQASPRSTTLVPARCAALSPLSSASVPSSRARRRAPLSPPILSTLFMRSSALRTSDICFFQEEIMGEGERCKYCIDCWTIYSRLACFAEVATRSLAAGHMLWLNRPSVSRPSVSHRCPTCTTK